MSLNVEGESQVHQAWMCDRKQGCSDRLQGVRHRQAVLTVSDTGLMLATVLHMNTTYEAVSVDEENRKMSML